MSYSQEKFLVLTKCILAKIICSTCMSYSYEKFLVLTKCILAKIICTCNSDNKLLNLRFSVKNL